MNITVQTDDLLTIPQAAKQIGISRITAWQWVKDGKLPAIILGGRSFVPKQTAEAMKRKRDYEAKIAELTKQLK